MAQRLMHRKNTLTVTLAPRNDRAEPSTERPSTLATPAHQVRQHQRNQHQHTEQRQQTLREIVGHSFHGYHDPGVISPSAHSAGISCTQSAHSPPPLEPLPRVKPPS